MIAGIEKTFVTAGGAANSQFIDGQTDIARTSTDMHGRANLLKSAICGWLSGQPHRL